MKAEGEDIIPEDDEFRDNGNDDKKPMAGIPSDAMSDVKLASRCGMLYTRRYLPLS